MLSVSHAHEASPWLPWLMMPGFFSPIIVAASVLVASAMDRAVNPVHQSISLLMDGPGKGLLEWGLVLSGLCMLANAWGFLRGMANGIRLAFWQALLGAGLMLSGIFMQHHLPTARQWALPSPWGPLTPIGLVHVGGATLLYCALVGSCWAVFRLSDSAVVTSAAVLVGLCLALLLVGFLVTAATRGPSGLFERFVAALGILWEFLVMTLGWRWVHHA